MLPFVRRTAVAALVALAASAVPAPAEPPAGLPAADAKQIDQDLKELGARLGALRAERPLAPGRADLGADAEVFRKGVEWALKYETKLEPADVALVKKALARGAERAAPDSPLSP